VTAPDDKRALSAEERDTLREYATDDAQNGRSDAELSGRLTLRLLAEHDALKAELAACRRERDSLARSFDAAATARDEMEAQFVACRRERDEARAALLDARPDCDHCQGHTATCFVPAPDDKRALSAEYEPLTAEELARVSHQVGGVDNRNTRAGARDTMVCARIVVIEHAALKDERNAALRDLAEAREQLDAERKRSAFLEEELDQREESRDRFAAELAACRRERDALGLLVDSLCADAEAAIATVDSKSFRDDQLPTLERGCRAARRARDQYAAAQSAPSEREAPAYVNEPDPDTGCYDCGHLLRCKRHAPQPDAPSEREAPLATMRADECSCVDHGCCGISYAGCPVHDLPIGSDAAPQPAEATAAELPSDCVHCGLILEDDGECVRCGPQPGTKS
jgi:hypothetical protein